MKEKTTKRLWIAVAIGVIILTLLILIASIVDLGEKIGKIGVGFEIRGTYIGLEHGFYLISFLLTYFLIINPVRIILVSPAFNIETVLDKPSRKRYLTYKKVSKTLIKNKDISLREEVVLRDAMKDPVELQQALQKLYNTTLKKKINQIIRRNSRTVMVSTAISQNGRLDFFATLSVNIKMIKEIVVACGFRPSYKNLSKLTLKVFSTALIAEGLDKVDFSELLPSTTQNVLKSIPFAKTITNSVAQGISNGLLTLRIGIVTRKYLFADTKELTKEKIRKGAFVESIKIIPAIIKDAFASMPERLRSIFKKEEKEQEPAA